MEKKICKISRFYEIRKGSHATESNLDAIFLMRTFNHSKMADVRTSEVDEKLPPVNVGQCNFVW
jgi:hypothetical protein